MKTPCVNLCTYEEINGIPTCKGCFRTYDDLERWSYMDDAERKNRMKQFKQEKKLYENKQKNNANMGRKS